MNSLNLLRNLAVILFVAFALPVSAQMGSGSQQMEGQGSMKGPMHEQSGKMQMSDMMHDMGEQMMSMSREMSHGDTTPERHKQMMKQMDQMSEMIEHMSGMMGKGMMGDGMMNPKHQKQMDRMREQMNKMKRMHSGGPR